MKNASKKDVAAVYKVSVELAKDAAWLAGQAADPGGLVEMRKLVVLLRRRANKHYAVANRLFRKGAKQEFDDATSRRIDKALFIVLDVLRAVDHLNDNVNERIEQAKNDAFFLKAVAKMAMESVN